MEGALRPGERVADRFEVVALAGTGGVGSVYRALELASGRVVALKLLHPDNDSELRFAREAAVLASLRHPGVVQYLDYGLAEGGKPFLVMEWLVGEDLDARLRRGVLDLDDALTVVRGAAVALAAAHRQGIVHRDLKPANLFLVDGRVDHVKVVDFGLALPASDDELTDPGVLIGTPAYMSPEQVRGERVDARADVYAMGTVLFRCLVGAAPFRGDNQLAVLAKVLVEEAPDLPSVRPDLPAEVGALVARLLAKSVAQRPADGGALVEALEALRAPGRDAHRLMPAVSASEQRVACVVLSASAGRRRSGRPPRPPAQDVTMPMTLPASPDPKASMGRFSSGRHQVLREAVKAVGGALDVLADGTRLVTVRGASPAEQAVLAARCALALGALRPSGFHVVATGRVVEAGGLQVGEVIDRAAEALLTLRAQDDPGVRLDEGTARLLDDRFEVRGEGPWRALVRVREGPPGVRTVLGRVTPCAGRARELASLGAALDDCVHEPRARAVLVVAPAGMGKTRLLQEFLGAAVAARAGVEALPARGDVARAGSPFAIASQLLRHAAGIADGDPPAARARRLRAMAEAQLGPARGPGVAEFLGELCDAHTPQAEASDALRAARAESTLMADALREAWTAWLRARCARAPTALVIEDLQWGDHPSLNLIDAALEALADAPLLVVATARPEAREAFPHLWARRAREEIHLGPLPRRAAEQVAREALGGAVDDATLRAIVERSGGHPFHIEELARAVAAGSAPDVVPDSVLGMLQARIALLDGDARRVLRAASVFGEGFWPGGVAALLGGRDTPQTVVGRLAGLVAEEVVVRRPASRLAGEAEYGFRHALVRDAAYAMLPERDRAHAHRLAGEWLEAAGETDPAALGDHFERGGARARAAEFLRRAAQQAMEGNDLARASSHALRAIACGAEAEALGSLRAILSEVAYWRGEIDQAAEQASAAVDLLEPGTPAWFDAVSVALGAYGQRGRNDDVARWLDRAAHARTGPGARGAHVSALCRGLTQLYWAHHASDLRDAHARLYALAQPFETLEPYHAGWVYRVQAEGLWLRARDVDRSLEAFDRSCDAYARAGARRTLCLTWINSASLHGWAGEFERAAALLDLASAEAERLRSGFLTVYGRAVRALTDAWAGNAGVVEAFREVLPGVGPSPRVEFVVRVFLGDALFARGDVGGAEAQCSAALGLPVATELRPAAMALFARVLAAKKAVSQAVEVAREAARVDRDAPDIELTEGMADLALAELLDARGDRGGALAALAPAHARLAAVAAKMASPERRRRFWARRLPNDRVRDLALAWGLVAGDA